MQKDLSEPLLTQPKRHTQRRNLVVLLLTMSISLTVFLLLQEPSGVPAMIERSSLVGHPAPDFTISTWNRTPYSNVHLASLQKKVTVLNFWASWCDACRVEAPLLEATWQKYRSQGVMFVGVAYADNKTDGISFLRKYSITYPSGPDMTGNIAKAYKITNIGIPQTIFLDHRGIVVNINIGAINDGSLNSIIQMIFKGKRRK